MRRTRGVGAVTIIVVVALVLTGCTGPRPKVSVRPSPTPFPSSLPTRTPPPAAVLDGWSQPYYDPVYPDFGNPVIDVLHYELALEWQPGLPVCVLTLVRFGTPAGQNSPRSIDHRLRSGYIPARRDLRGPPYTVDVMYSTRVTEHIDAPRAAVYRALLDADAIARWRVPEGMRSEVHRFDAREGGAFRVSLTYEAPDSVGKSSAHTDTYHGHFVRLVLDEQVVEKLEFETAEPALRGTMTMTTTLTDADGGTRVVVVHEGIPDAIPAADNELGTRMALRQLARLVEATDVS